MGCAAPIIQVCRLCAQVPHTLPVPFASTKYTHGMANYLKAVGPCSTVYPPHYTGPLQKGCHPT